MLIEYLNNLSGCGSEWKSKGAITLADRGSIPAIPIDFYNLPASWTRRKVLGGFMTE